MSKIKNTLAKAGINTFFFLLVLSIFLAYHFPEWGSEGSVIPFNDLTFYGVSFIFFFYGVKLDPKSLKRGLSNWKLHLLIQVTTFLIFPAIILLLNAGFGAEGSLLWLGIFYLAALPSTVSSSVVMVSIAGGNLPAAIFNASISSIIGIFITPLWMEMFLSASGSGFDLGSTFIQLILQILLPVMVGFSLHRLLGKWAAKHNQTLKKFDQLIILLIVFTAFSESFAQKMFGEQSFSELFLLSGAMLLLFLCMMAVMNILSLYLGFSRPDRIAVLFCGSKKSLVQGAVMGKVLFPDPVVLGVILLPLMIYHALQLVAGSAIAQRMALREEI
ncbi:MAG: bile acid:sodium symporter family protein [Anditalea sp.]